MSPSRSDPSSPTISVIVPTYRRPDALKETLAALYAVDYPRERYELIVVDDARDGSPASVIERHSTDSWAPRMVLGPGIGPGAARNSGAEVARNEFLLFCDDDVIVDRSHLKRHLHVQELRGPCLCASISMLDARVERVLESKPFGRYWLDLERSYATVIPEPGPDGLAELDPLSIRNLCLPRSSFEELGGFDPELPFAAEDQDLCIRAATLGLPRLIDHRNRVRHLETRLDFPRFCEREQRGAESYAVFVRKYPKTAGRSELATVNDPAIRPGEGLRARVKKLVKQALGRERALRALQALVRGLERLRLPDVLIRRVYRTVVGVYIARGFRKGLARLDGDFPTPGGRMIGHGPS